jgi:predicted O-methyltransferase YrrM/ADP-heptose:LPS heptosyltransferase
MPRPCHEEHAPRPQDCRVCRWCADRTEKGTFYRRLWGEPEPSPACQVVATADGIGDAVLALTAAEGLRHDDPGRAVYYVAKPWTVNWARLLWPDDLVVTEPLPGVPELRPHDTYAAQNAERLQRPRWEHYAAACGTRARLPQPRPLPEEALAWAEPYRGYVILAPWSGYERTGAPPWAPNSRVWLRSHWLHLERLLNDRGHRTAIIDNADARNALFRGDKLIGQPPQRVAALMRASACVVANDSGMAHVAGALGAATVAICAQVRGEQVFGIYSRVRVLQGPLPCSGCHWLGPDWRPACEGLCASLQAVQPEAVLAAVEARADGGPPLDERLRRELARRDGPLWRGGPWADRSKTFAQAVRHVLSRPGPRVVETGCQRADEDLGAGASTRLFGEALARHGGRLVSVDSDARNVAFARGHNARLPVEVVHADSRDWLRGYSGPPVDLLYLDSADVGTPGYQECCLEEARLALPHLAEGALILIDDSPRGADGWAGKGVLAIPWLLGLGWRVVEEGYQVLLGGGARGDPLADPELASLIRQHSLLDPARLASLAAAVRATAALPGAMAEAGTYRGGSALLIASAAPGKKLHVFDALGIPEDDLAAGGQHRRGEFDGSPEQLRLLLAGRDVRFHFGVFPQTAGEVPPDERFSLVHLDLDTLQSTRAALEYFWPRLVPGGLIVLDDLDWQHCPGVRQALAEVLPSVPVETPAPYQGLVCKPH